MYDCSFFLSLKELVTIGILVAGVVVSVVFLSVVSLTSTHQKYITYLLFKA